MLSRFLQNHVLANLAFLLILIVGFLHYGLLPREQDPTINFNWIQITTFLPGASARDVEKRVTDPLEQAITAIPDIRFVSSNSRESISSILVRFEDLDERTFDKRVTDLRREIDSEQENLPEEVIDPIITELTTSNAYPSASVVVVGNSRDENLRAQARFVQKDIERISGVDRVTPAALPDPELHVDFDPRRLYDVGLLPTDLADSVSAWFRDVAAGSVRAGDQEWLIRLQGTSNDPQMLAGLPVVTAQGELPLDNLARVERGREKAERLVSFEGRPAVLLAVTKQEGTNTLELVERVQAYVEERQLLKGQTGVDVILADDQTQMTREALDIMQTNAWLGLFFVLLVTWMFLGLRIAFLTSVGIPFILAGTFWVLFGLDQSLNVVVLLGVVISLGMLVDDAVVVVEGIYYRLQNHMPPLEAVTDTLKEVAAPVTSSVATTMAAFLPLMLLPGILGKFMLVLPMVVTLALAISLIEAFWMLPAHVLAAKVNFANPGRVQRLRNKFTHKVRIIYSRMLIRSLRWPIVSVLVIIGLFSAAGWVLQSGKVKVDFFASDPVRLFYVNVKMPAGTPLEDTQRMVEKVEAEVRKGLRDGEARAVVAYSGQQFTETEPLFGDTLGQLLVSLNPRNPERAGVGDLLGQGFACMGGDTPACDGLGALSAEVFTPAERLREVRDIVDALRPSVLAMDGAKDLSFLVISGGPPAGKDISVKVRGDDYEQIGQATTALKEILATMPAVSDVTDDATEGSPELKLVLDTDAVRRAGLDPLRLSRTVRLLVDGEIVADFQHQGDEVEVRVRAEPREWSDVGDLLRLPLALPGGGETTLGTLVKSTVEPGLGNIRHYNFRRTITVEANVDKEQLDVVTANAQILEAWEKIADQYPEINLDFTGVLDDINESLDSIAVLFLLGVGLMYLILGTQFRSYFQPLMIITTVPMAFIGVVFGLLLSNGPLSLFTLYGVVALSGIAVNAAIVMISAANVRLERGMTVDHATIFAARRRVVPIMITTLTTIAGLFSLAAGLGGESLIWGTVANSIVWGLAFSSMLTLFVIPLMYRFFMRLAHR